MANQQETDYGKRNLTFEDAKIIFRNFEGKADKFNPPGKRTFSVLLSNEDAEILTRNGFNVKWLPGRDEGDPDQAFMKVNVSYAVRAPKIVLISEAAKSKTFLDEDSVHILDWADIKSVDFIVTPYDWEVGGNSGTAAYLKKMFVTLEEDELELKYATLPDSDYVEDDYDEDFESDES